MWPFKELVGCVTVLVSLIFSCNSASIQLPINTTNLIGEIKTGAITLKEQPKLEEHCKNLLKDPFWKHIHKSLKICTEDCWDIKGYIAEEDVERAVVICVLKNINKCDFLQKDHISNYLMNNKCFTNYIMKTSTGLSNKNVQLQESNRVKRQVNEKQLYKEGKLAQIESNGKSKLFKLIQSISLASSELENAIRNATTVLREVGDTGKNITESQEAKQLKNVTEEAKHLIQTISRSGKKISESFLPLPIQTSLAVKDFAVDTLLDSGIKTLSTDEAAQLKSAIDDGKEVASVLVDSGIKAINSVKSLTKQITVGNVVQSHDSEGEVKIETLLSEEIRPLKTTIGSGMTAVGRMTENAKRLTASLSTLPLQAIVNVSNFALDDMLGKVINVSKSDEAFLLNLALISGVSTAENAKDSSIKFVDSVKDIPVQAISSIKSIASEAVNNINKNTIK